MLWYTHIAFGFLAGLLSISFLNPGNIYIFFALAIAGALLPDIDTPNSKIGSKFGIFSKLIESVFGHRGIVHTFWGMAVSCGLFWFFISKNYAAALFAGFFSHLIADGFTKKGINFFHPFGKLHLSGFIETGSTGEMILFVLIIALITIIVI